MNDTKSVKPRTDAETLDAIRHWVDDDGDDNDDNDDVDDGDLDDFDASTDGSHLAAADEPSASVKQWAREQHAQMRPQIAALRRQLTTRHPPIQHEPPVSPEIRALSRSALIAQLGELLRGGAVQFAHMDLDGATEEDLRQMLALLAPGQVASDEE